MKRLLAIDGGGIRGIIPATVIEELEQRAGKPVRELFDMIAGNSTGGIIATGLLAGIEASRLVSLYVDHGSEIFANEDRLRGALRPRYSAAPLENILHTMLGDAWLGDTTGPELLVPAQCL
ncbi:MAG: patatin-like phospholipase family protein, partial [Patescibacteria group bacterium]|nr:patatin-like phospholipase family protein [Patescibacteria group bacterium]